MRAEREARFAAVLANNEDETFDARLIKLVLAKGVAAPEIRAQASSSRAEPAISRPRSTSLALRPKASARHSTPISPFFSCLGMPMTTDGVSA